MAKLTPTELKVLATEAQNRIVSAIDARNEEIKNQKEYINFEKDFRQSVIGQTFLDLINTAILADEIIEKSGFLLGNRTRDLETLTKERMDTYCRFLKNKTYPLVDVNRLPQNSQKNPYWGYQPTVYDHFLHELQLKQLTSNTDLMELLENMVTDFIKKI